MITDFYYDGITKTDLKRRRKLEDACEVRGRAMDFALRLPLPWQKFSGNKPDAQGLVAEASIIERYLLAGVIAKPKRAAKAKTRKRRRG